VGGFYVMSTEICFAVIKTTKINKSPGWNGFDWVIECVLWWGKPPWLKEIDRRSLFSGFRVQPYVNGLWFD
jgi:hypothetical protein